LSPPVAKNWLHIRKRNLFSFAKRKLFGPFLKGSWIPWVVIFFNLLFVFYFNSGHACIYKNTSHGLKFYVAFSDPSFNLVSLKKFISSFLLTLFSGVPMVSLERKGGESNFFFKCIT